MDTIVISHDTALRAVRTSRRRYASLAWEPVDRASQQRVLDACVPNACALDLKELERLGVWSPDQGPLDVLVSSTCARRPCGGAVRPHLDSHALPANSLLSVAKGVYAVSPALAVVQYAEDHAWQEVLGLTMELCGTFSLPDEPPDCRPVGWGSSDPEIHSGHEDGDFGAGAGSLGWRSDAAGTSGAGGERPAGGYVASEPVLTTRQLKRYLSYAKDIRGLPCARRAAEFALDRAASPMEAIMAVMFHAPMSAGGFNIKDMQLNRRMEFSHDAVLASGMPYAVLDAYIAAADAALEYNGHYHDAPSSRVHDEKRTCGLAAMGILTIPVNDEQLRNIDALEAIARILYRRMGKRFRYSTEGYYNKQTEFLNHLRRQMGLKPC